jgi:hypothetical protein
MDIGSSPGLAALWTRLANEKHGARFQTSGLARPAFDRLTGVFGINRSQDRNPAWPFAIAVLLGLR